VAQEARSAALSRALADIEELYSSNLSEHGIDSRSVGWPNPESQLVRFEKLAYLIDADAYTGPIAVNDLGCGYGAMFPFLAARLGPRLTGYRGYDISHEMLVAAQRHVDDARASFVPGAQLDRDAD
jgi:SAM-dependent methyltransferase